MKEQARHNREECRFEIEAEGATAFLEYEDRGEIRVLTHTYVPPEHRGKGIAAYLVAAALDATREEGKSVDPQCSYIVAFLAKHPEYADLQRR